MIDLPNLNQNLNPQPQSMLVVDQFYNAAYNEFKFRNWCRSLLSMIKVAAFPFFVVYGIDLNVRIWFFCILLVSLSQLIFTYFFSKIADQTDTYYQIANIWGHSQSRPITELDDITKLSTYRVIDQYDFTDPEKQPQKSQIIDLSFKIKTTILDQHIILFYQSKVQFIIYQLVHFWGLILYLFKEGVDDKSKICMAIVICVGTYQYIQFYLVIVFVALILPFFLLRKIYHKLMIKYKKYKLNRELKSVPYNHQRIKGDKQCRICYVDYAEKENVVVLSCSQLHHFHEQCIREWTKVAIKCPMCRKDLI